MTTAIFAPVANVRSVNLVSAGDHFGLIVEAEPYVPSLSSLLPQLHNMGIQVQYQLQDPRRPAFCELWLDRASSARIASIESRENLCDFLRRLFNGEAEDGRLNGLVLDASCNAHEVMLIRAAVSYLRQTGLHFSLRYVADRLRRHPAAVRAWLDFIVARLDPDLGDDRSSHEAAALTQLKRQLEDISDADSHETMDRLRLLGLAITRTNYFRFDSRLPLPPYLAFKVDGGALPFLPAPRPYRETFVFSERFEGVHLRGGPISRGGLRWSDRREDYRTEVLGLVKAQLIKNAVIVPTGAKGGFVCKTLQPQASCEQVDAEGRAMYEQFINGLLDLADNQDANGKLVPPARVVCRDGPDDYLVVAADKGTASFSDIANRVALQRSFWLGDAFASGGSVGYDHKKIGITAKGAWESARLRFSEAGIGWTDSHITAVGIGDMSGDVFGNGMLIMPQLRLIAAFDHRHIFIDPQPDPQRAFLERRRMFELATSCWDDFDRGALSEGGGIWSRNERLITLSEQARNALHIESSSVTPEQLIQAILRAPVTVLFNGGVGTYVKASSQSHAQVADPKNNLTRVDATQVRARVIVEGGNLGLTQAARVEFAARGGYVFNDALDNSGGVDCSDHEVNIKIALRLDKECEQNRVQVLRSVAEEVEAAVLANSKAQARRVLRHAANPKLIGDTAAFIRSLESRTGLDRALEVLPDDVALASRPNSALLGPEVAVVLAHAKMALKNEWLASDTQVLKPWHLELLRSYFPSRLRALPLHKHPLARAIVASTLANDAVNRLGIGCIERLACAHKCSTTRVLDAYAFCITAALLDGANMGDACVAVLPGPQRHAVEARIENCLAQMVSDCLANPEGVQTTHWEVIQSMIPGSTSSDEKDPAAFVERRQQFLSLLWRALPLSEAADGLPRTFEFLKEVERVTGTEAVLQRLSFNLTTDEGQLLLRCLKRSLHTANLQLCSTARRIGGEVQTAVDAALVQLHWEQAFARIRTISIADAGLRGFEKIFEEIARLDSTCLPGGLMHGALA